ncbi:MAG: FimV/HubP family polar landmark protein [Pseudomonadota bacterium]
MDQQIQLYIAVTVVILVLLLIWLLWTFHAKKNAKPLHHGSPEKKPATIKIPAAQASGKSSDYNYLAGDDVMASKLDLARSYIDMGDKGNARDILLSVLQEGDKKQKAEAKELLSKI